MSLTIIAPSCKAGCALESACCATGVAATCSCTVSWGIDGIAVPCGLCRLSAAFAQWQQHSFLTTPVVSSSGVDVSTLWPSPLSGWQNCPARSKGCFRLPLARCGASTCTLLHAIRECPLFDTQRHTWVERLSLRRVPLFGDAELLRWIFDSHLVPNNHSAVNAHVHYVASICQIARSFRIARDACAEQTSWANAVLLELARIAVVPPFNWGITAGTPQTVVRAWLRHVRGAVSRHSNLLYSNLLCCTSLEWLCSLADTTASAQGRL